jgi:hypothetical protein
MKRKHTPKPIDKLVPVETIKVRLWGGPLHDTQVEIPRGTRVYLVGTVPFWTYEDTDQKDPAGQPLFAVRPIERQRRLFLKLGLMATKRDQRLYVPSQPYVVLERECKHGRGAAKRRAAKEAASVRMEG